jgi:hypothetical protein
VNRGSVALYLLFSIVLSIGAGYGVYRVMRESRLRAASAAPAGTTIPSRTAIEPMPPQEPAVAPAPRPEPAVERPSGASDAQARAIEPDIEGDDTAARVLLGIPGIAGAMPRDSVQRHFRARSAPLQRCYEHFVEGGTRGVIHVRFRIDTDGTLLEPRVAGFNAQFDDCVAALAATIKFSQPRDGKTVEVVYPIGFR